MWESIALNKASNCTDASNAELDRLFDTAAMGLRNYEESAQLKEREVDNVTLVTCFTTHNQGGYQQRHLRPTQSQNQSNAVTGKQVTCWNCEIRSQEIRNPGQRPYASRGQALPRPLPHPNWHTTSCIIISDEYGLDCGYVEKRLGSTPDDLVDCEMFGARFDNITPTVGAELDSCSELFKRCVLSHCDSS
ncbi:hypothetical protein NDA12_007604 [Ustilago hordei]|nr:hypothetical protein NDA12_007604 [Ustilago hordei]